MNGFFTGVRFLFRGIGFWGKRPAVMLLGAIPALIASVLLLSAMVVLIVNIDDVSAWLTGFADGWNETVRTSLQVVAGVLTVVLSGWLSTLLFVGLTLTIGDPFYEAINRRVEAEYGPVKEDERGVMTGILHAAGDALRLLVTSIVLGVLLFAIGLIPIVGTVIAIVLGAFIGGWFLAVEVMSYPFNRRAVRYREYRKLLKKRRSTTYGFGVAIFLLFLIPLGAVLVMPAAVAGGTLLAREVLGETN